jgi:hypothetical protein
MHNYHSKAIPTHETATRNPNLSIAIPAAIMGGTILITYFLLIALMGYETVTQLRFVNFVLLIPVLVYAIKTYLNTVHRKSYMEAFRVSVLSYLGSYAILAIFMFIYLMVLNPDFLTYLQVQAFPLLKLNAFGVMAMLLGEGSIGAVVLSFVVLQYFKSRIKRVV